MLYSFIKIIARLALPLYCRNIRISNRHLLQHKGPLLLAVNHPNSFLDAIILCTLFNKPVHSLARGDAFKNKWAARMLYLFRIFPVYRVTEGVENLEENYKTFDQCKEVFRKNGIILIFSEGRCINEWHLRPLRKGTARLAISSWNDGIGLDVLPVAINYSSFKRFGKNIHIFLGDKITREQVAYKAVDGIAIRQFNDLLRQQLSGYVFEIAKTDKETLHEKFYVRQPLWKKIVLAIPAAVGFIVHAPLYLAIKKMADGMNKEPGHFDSKIVGLLFLLYPLFLLLVTSILCLLTHRWLPVTLLLILPFTAWSFVQLKKQLD
ncbi:MAG: 1-acyl-sn-glycerol-3-phosphate acyltransferase [Chitinophagales bacterium]|nr:1-acyl-sn-glycerol-3-phosphate acyltransferase [Chitinophagales bacterium]